MSDDVKEVVIDENKVTDPVVDPTKKVHEPVPYDVFAKYATEKTRLSGALAEANVKMEEYSNRMSGMESKLTEYKGYKEQIDKFNTDRLTERTTKWNDMAKVLSAVEGDKNYDKVQHVLGKFNMATEDVKLTDEQLTKNFELMEIYNDTNYFEVEKVDTKLNIQKPVTKETRVVGDGKYYGYETPTDLVKADWKLAEKWKKENNGRW